MAQQTQKMTSSSKASTTTTSVIRLINVDKSVIKNGDSQTKCAQQEQNEALAVQQPHENQIDDSSDGSKAPDTTKIIEMDTDCSRTILVDTKALNRQKELDERYGG